jgi:asparagine synthase (glutamine-hydrolysing)
MCGIGGVYSFSDQLVKEDDINTLNRMKNFMHLRGPDASDTKIFKNVGLIHTRLSIMDPAPRSTQPMESNSWILSFNGEIINFIALRTELKKHHDFETNSDTEVLLYALETWGVEKTLHRVAGMFAFLAYNKATGVLIAARDQLGIKPLYYHKQLDKSVWFASTPATIIESLSTNEWRENSGAIGSFFALGAPFTLESTTSGVMQIPPATYMTIEPDATISFNTYWAPEYQTNFTMDDLLSVVSEYKISDVKSALFMSGGIDSTFLASALKSMDFFHIDSPERNYAQKVARKYNSPLVVVRPDPDDYVKGLETVCKTFGEPLMSCGIPYSVSNEANKRGYKMAISANGADELFFGYPRTPLGTSQNVLPKFEDYSNLWFSEQVGHIFRDKRHFNISEYQSDIPSLLEVGQSILKSCRLDNFPKSASYRWLELMTYVLNDLNPTLDAASMANSLEVRVPFLDHRVVQGILSWPTDKLCTKEFGRKSPLKAHLNRDFNRTFLNRPKLGFSIDKRILSNIQTKTENVFSTYLDNKFIQFNNKPFSAYYERDKIYLKSIMHIFSIWKSQTNHIKQS